MQPILCATDSTVAGIAGCTHAVGGSVEGTRAAPGLGASTRVLPTGQRAPAAPDCCPIDAGIGCFESGDLEMARQHFLVASHARPSDPAPRRWLARVLRGLGRPAEALAAWHALLAVLPDDFEALLRAGEAGLATATDAGAQASGFRASAARSAAAEALLVRAAVIRPQDPRPVTVLANHYVWTGRMLPARRLVAQALRAQPRSVALWAFALQTVAASGRVGLAGRLLRRLQRALRGSFADQFLLADISIAAGHLGEARSLLTDLAAAGPGQGATVGLAVEKLGLLALARGDLAEAGRYARRADAPPGLAAAVDACLRHRHRHLQQVHPGGRPWPADPGGNWLDSFTGALHRTRRAIAIAPRSGVVLHILNSLAAGGTERQCARLAVEQARRDAAREIRREIWVVRTDSRRAGRGAFFLDEIVRAGVHTATLADFAESAAAIQARVDLLREPPAPLGGLINLAEIAGIAAAIAALRPAAIQAWTPQTCAHAAVAGLVLGVPRIILRGGSVSPAARDAGDQAQAERAAVLRRLLRAGLADTATVLVNNTRRNLDDWLAWLALPAEVIAGRAVVVPNMRAAAAAAHSRAGEGEDLRRRHGLAPDAIVVGGVMRLEREKDPELWLDVVTEVCARRPRARCLLLGDGRLRPLIAARLDRRGLAGRVMLTGLVRGDCDAYYRLFDLLLLTSRHEGLPNVVIEAAAAGVPVVATDVGGVAEAMLPGQSGLLVQGRRPKDLAAVVTALIDDPSRRRAMGAAGRAFAGRFAPQAVLPLWDALDGGPHASARTLAGAPGHHGGPRSAAGRHS